MCRQPRSWYAFVFTVSAVVLIGTGCDSLLIVDEDVVFIAFGDSSTAGPSSKDYIEYLPDLLNRPVEEFANQGKGGETTSEGFDRLERLVQQGVYPNSRTIIYWQGGTDVIDFVQRRDPLLLLSPNAVDYPHTEALTQQLDDTQRNIEQVITLADEAGWNIIVANYFPIPQTVPRCDALFLDVVLPSQAVNAGEYVRRVNQRIRLAAIAGGAKLFDVGSFDDEILADPGNYFDCNHLSASGNLIVAQHLAEVIEELPQSP